MPKFFKYSLHFRLFLSLMMTMLMCFQLSPQSLYAKEPSIPPPEELKPQRALDLNKKRGLSLLTLPKGSSGLGINVGLNTNSFGELIIGGDWRQPNARSAELNLRLSLGAHIQLIQARDDAMLTFGARFRVIYSEICEVDPALCADRSAVSPLTPQYAVELPLRIYWFPNKYISIHSELGTSISWGEGGATKGETSLSGVHFILFSQSNVSGQLGLSLWF